MRRLAALAVSTAFFLLLSRRSLQDRRSHGFFRFFAFESTAALVLLNSRRWFAAPFSLRQLVSWPLLAGSAALAAHGFYLLRVAGKPQPGLAGTEALVQGIENTSELVQTGAYRYIRHPLYGSLLLLAWGAFAKDPSRLGAMLALSASAWLTATAEAEEIENLRRFGADYARYMRRTRMFIPYLI